MDFDARLRKAIERGTKTRARQDELAQQQELTEEELRQLHSGFRIELSDHIENCLRSLVDHFPGFDFSTVVGDEGWGARIRRDDIDFAAKRPGASLYSRFEMLITPFRPGGTILEVAVKGTVRNREVINRKHFEKLTDVDIDLFRELIDQRALEYAEHYSAAR
ncbi:MAG: hypothetical protein KDA88_18065 [Planctomycetaceae bacterium]|nr:hypothetical protein [Planctomycetaceae bacterium]MCB9951019.1 hypothetical protein [Planctomycetaceae bacterium]